MRPTCLLLTAALLAGAVGTLAPSAGATTAVHSVAAGGRLAAGQRLVSPAAHYYASVESDGRLVVRTAAGRHTWTTPATTAHAGLSVGRDGQLAVGTSRRSWTAGTSGSGGSDVLHLGDDGVLSLTSGGLLVWSSRAGNRCPHTRGKTLSVDLGDQFARMCANGQQLRATPVTSGASAKGDATPKGTWHVQRKVRNTTLHPAAGGAYHVHYWVPYDGPYGVHDSPWQTFAYGSAKYRTDGSHGCIHLPGAAMAWFYDWVRIGTTVTIRG